MDSPDKTTSSHFYGQRKQETAPTLVCSIPKAGTYLVSAVLDELEIQNTRLHISKDVATLHCRGTLEDFRNRPEDFKINLPLRHSVSKILPGTYAVGHLPYTRETRRICSDLKVITIKRDLRDCVVSLMRFVEATRRDGCTTSDWFLEEDDSKKLVKFLHAYQWYFSEWVAPVIAWRKHPKALSIQFEDLMGDSGETSQSDTVRRICVHLGIDANSINIPQLIIAAKAKPTLTRSGQRTNLANYWSSEAEELFAKYGGKALNRSLGYEDRQGSMFGLAHAGRLFRLHPRSR